MLETLFLLLVGHALADFALQPEIMAKLKNRKNKPDSIPEGQKYVPTWGYWLSAHGLIHGGMVYAVIGNAWLGMLETVLHAVIDFLKCENKTNPNDDQFLHFLCKISYLSLLF